MVDYHGRFAWYELITTDMAAAQAFYTKVVGWGAQDASTPGLPYTLFTAGKASVSGLMDLPEEARRMGATPRWMGYVGVKDVDATVDRLKASWRSRVRSADGQQHRPHCGRRRPANRQRWRWFRG